MRIELIPKSAIIDITASMMGNKQRDMEKLQMDLAEAVGEQWWGTVVSDAQMIIQLAMSLSTLSVVHARCKRLHGEEVSSDEEH